MKSFHNSRTCPVGPDTVTSRPRNASDIPDGQKNLDYTEVRDGVILTSWGEMENLTWELRVKEVFKTLLTLPSTI